MNQYATSNFELIRSFPRSRAPLPRMDELSYQTEFLLDHDEEDSSNLDDNDIDIDEESNDDVDTSVRINRHKNLENEPMKKHFISKQCSIYKENLKETIEQKKFKTKKVQRTKRHIFFWVVCLIPVFGALFLMTNGSIAGSSKNGTELYQSEINLIKDLEQNIDSIRQTFKKQSPEIWVDFTAGIAEVVQYQHKPAVFFLFANQDDTMLCLAKMIANASKAALGSDDNLWLTAADMGSDYGMVIDKFEDKIKEQKVVIVDNLLNIDSKAILAFHHLCDKENPLVRKAVYIITMIAEGYSNKQKPIQFVENQLLHKMKDTINKDKLQPLITRITDGPIIPIQPESDMRNCPLRY